MANPDPSKTETATSKRRDKTRKEGNVPKSQEAGKVVTLLAGLIGLYLFMTFIAEHLFAIAAWFFERAPLFEVSARSIYTLFTNVAVELAIMLLPVMIFIMICAYIVQRLQVGPLWTTKPLQPKLKMLNLINGIKRLFSPKALVNTGRTVAQAGIIALAPYLVLTQEMHKLSPLFYSTPAGIAIYMLETGALMVIYALIPMLIIAVLDVWYTRYSYEESIKMSKDEVKDERKQADGDPEVKRQIRTKMMEAMAQRMMQDVPNADVVITNPTHVAVAIQYNAAVAPAPVVIAKGLDNIALKIKEIARENNVPIRENKILARALYKSVEIGETIPEELYQAVAAILAELFRKKQQ